jgi:hypothetical protein
MQFRKLIQCALFLCMAAAALAQTAGPPTEMKPPGDPTSNDRPATPATTAPVPAKTTAPEPAPVTGSVESAQPAANADAKPAPTDAKPESDKGVPTTTVYPDVDPKKVLAPKLDPGPLPENKSALIGGTVRDIDQIRNQMTVDVFGKGGKMKVLFDPRTRFDRDGVAANQTTIKKGDQVYLDTQLVNHKIFARDVYLRSGGGTADASGQITSYNAKTRELTLRDQLSQSTVTVHLSPTATIRGRDGASGSTANLQPNALVAVKLTPAGAGHTVANEIDVIAMPGSEFTFYGTLTHIDLRSGLLAVDNKSDHKLYDIHFEPAGVGAVDDLKIGSEVAVNAVFNGRDYTAKTVSVSPSHPATPE